MDLYTIFNIFLTTETGIIIAAVMSVMEFVIKPLLSSFSWREDVWFKHTILPLVVLALCIICSFIIMPTGLSAAIGIKILYGMGVGLCANFIYKAGISKLSDKIGVESKISNSIFPPKKDDK